MMKIKEDFFEVLENNAQDANKKSALNNQIFLDCINDESLNDEALLMKFMQDLAQNYMLIPIYIRKKIAFCNALKFRWENEKNKLSSQVKLSFDKNDVKTFDEIKEEVWNLINKPRHTSKQKLESCSSIALDFWDLPSAPEKDLNADQNFQQIKLKLQKQFPLSSRQKKELERQLRKEERRKRSKKAKKQDQSQIQLIEK